MRKNAKTITSPHGTSFKKGQKVYSYGDKTTFGFIESWDYASECWRIQKELGNNDAGFFWWPDDEPTLFKII